MGGLLPVLWALLACAEFAGGKKQPGLNLSCYQCFKVSSPELCVPTQCYPTDRVCVSLAVVLAKESRVMVRLSKRCAPRCPNTNMKYEWTLRPMTLGKVIRRCCSGHLCNRASAAHSALRGGFLLGAALGLLRAL